jgi:hypothetical protein
MSTYVPVVREKIRQKWSEIDNHTGGHDKNIQAPLTKLLLSDSNITKICYALRMMVWKNTKKLRPNNPLDIGMQNRASVYQRLYRWYEDLKYSKIEYTPAQLSPMLQKLNYAFVTTVLYPEVSNHIEDRELYNEWALKVPDPFPVGMNDNNFNKSVNMTSYYDESLGQGGYTNNSWQWGQESLYDEPVSIHKRYNNGGAARNGGGARPHNPPAGH